MTHLSILWAFVGIGLALLAGKGLRRLFPGLLLRMADPTNESGTLESFGYKQLLFEPFVGGGLFTAASVPLIVQFGALPMLAITGGLLCFWLVAGWLLFGRKATP